MRKKLTENWPAFSTLRPLEYCYVSIGIGLFRGKENEAGEVWWQMYLPNPMNRWSDGLPDTLMHPVTCSLFFDSEYATWKARVSKINARELRRTLSDSRRHSHLVLQDH